MEKSLKALVIRAARDVPPRTHDLLWLARQAALEPPPEILGVLGEFQAYCLAGRYPDSGASEIDRSLAESELARGRKAFMWLQSLFSE